MCVTECDISDVHYHEDDEVRVWEEAGSDHRPQDRVIREHVWAGDEEGEASGGGGWTPGGNLAQEASLLSSVFCQSPEHPPPFNMHCPDFITGPINNESFYCSHSQCSEGISM